MHLPRSSGKSLVPNRTPGDVWWPRGMVHSPVGANPGEGEGRRPQGKSGAYPVRLLSPGDFTPLAG